MFSPSVPAFIVKFAESVFEPQAFSPSGAHEPCQIHHHPSPSVYASIAAIVSAMSHTEIYTHVDSLLLWLSPARSTNAVTACIRFSGKKNKKKRHLHDKEKLWYTVPYGHIYMQ